jgi:hypothetical protein
MSRAFLILTTQPPPDDTDPSERRAVLAARRAEALETRTAALVAEELRSRRAGVEPPAEARRTWLAFVDRLGRTHRWPGLLRERGAR